jgi:hypothetical protein
LVLHHRRDARILSAGTAAQVERLPAALVSSPTLETAS